MSDEPANLEDLVDRVLDDPGRGIQLIRSGVPAAMLISMELWNMIRGTGVVTMEPEKEES